MRSLSFLHYFIQSIKRFFNITKSYMCATYGESSHQKGILQSAQQSFYSIYWARQSLQQSVTQTPVLSTAK